MRDLVQTDRAPAAVGPYSQAIVAGGWIWVSGQIGLDPETGEMVAGGVAEQARRSLTNLIAVLAAAGAGPDRVVRTTVYLTDMDDYREVNAVYGEFFGEGAPARACVAVVGLPKGARVEIDAVALS